MSCLVNETRVKECAPHVQLGRIHPLFATRKYGTYEVKSIAHAHITKFEDEFKETLLTCTTGKYASCRVSSGGIRIECPQNIWSISENLHR